MCEQQQNKARIENLLYNLKKEQEIKEQDVFESSKCVNNTDIILEFIDIIHYYLLNSNITSSSENAYLIFQHFSGAIYDLNKAYHKGSNKNYPFLRLAIENIEYILKCL
ncbi:MAG: hypothetical protein P8Y70_01575 [Candidatus Lokiarchaeota archaeon]